MLRKNRSKPDVRSPVIRCRVKIGFIMWIRIRAVIVEDEPLAAKYLATLLDETGEVEVVATGMDSEAGLRLCAELCPDAVFLDINLPDKDGIWLAKQLSMLPQPPLLVFTTGVPGRAADAFRLDAVDYLLKPLDPEQIAETVNHLLTERHIRCARGDKKGSVMDGTKRMVRDPERPREIR